MFLNDSMIRIRRCMRKSSNGLGENRLATKFNRKNSDKLINTDLKTFLYKTDSVRWCS